MGLNAAAHLRVAALGRDFRRMGYTSTTVEGYFHRYELERTTELGVAQYMGSRIFTPHRIGLAGHSRHVDARLRADRLGAVTVGYLKYGADVELVHESEIDDYHINIPLSGHAESWCGSESALATRVQAAVFLPRRPAGIKWPADCVQLCVKFSRADLELHVEGLLGRPVAKPLNIPVSMDLTTESGRSWLAVLSAFTREFKQSKGILQYPLIGRHVEELLMTGFLLQQPMFHALALGGDESGPPRTIKMAIDLIESRPEEIATITDLAREIGVSVRALQDGFKRHVGVPPLAYLREVRLNRARAELVAASPGSVTVAQTAMKWGFSHLGRFSLAYRRKFGMTPYQTLRANCSSVSRAV